MQVQGNLTAGPVAAHPGKPMPSGDIKSSGVGVYSVAPSAAPSSKMNMLFT